MSARADPPRWSSTRADGVFATVRSDGYALVDAFPAEELIDLATFLGEPKSDTRSSGVMLDLAPRNSDAARRNTLSFKHGTAPFPLHTEAAYWSAPPRYLLLLCVNPGRGNRPTLLLRPFDYLDSGTRDLLSDEPWVVTKIRHPFICSIIDNRLEMFRYDPECMRPYIRKSESVEVLGRLIGAEQQNVHWVRDRLLVIDNWQMMHGRGAAQANDPDRVLRRVLVSSHAVGL